VRLRLPHPLALLLGGLAVAAALTWILPAGEFDRQQDPATGRHVVVPGTYHEVTPAPVNPFRVFVAVPLGFVEAAEVVAAILFVGGAWVVADGLGTLGRLVGALAGALGHRNRLAIPVVSLFFASMGALENMQEEIIPLVPVLLVLGRRLGVDAVTAIAMSAGAAMVGSAFGPANPFQAGIAMQLAQLPPLAGGGIRAWSLLAAVVIWVVWTLRYAESRGRCGVAPDAREASQPATSRDIVIFVLMLLPMAAYVYGAIARGWGFNELSGGYVAAVLAVGFVGGLRFTATLEAYLTGMQGLVSAAIMVGVARSISVVLAEGRIIDTLLASLSAPLSMVPATAAAMLMIPFHAIVHVPVSSVSGHAVLTMPLLVPLSDLLGISRQVTVMAYQMGAGLTELITPTNGALMAILLAAGVRFDRWFRFAVVGVLLVLPVGILAMLVLP
jgi:uncharacterized ion transporter superfamily protein YfcC